LEQVFTGLRQWLEILYFISGIVVAIAALLGLKQVLLLKTDITTRNKRLSVEKSIEHLDRFAKTVSPLAQKYLQNIRGNGLSFYNGPIIDFKKIGLKQKSDFELCKKKLDLDPLDLLNELEVTAAAMVSGLADEKLAFNPLGRSYCDLVEKIYDVICLCRDEEEYYSNIVALYQLWKPRIDKIDLEKQKQKIDKDLACITDKDIPPIGV
jgi:hypothetical protein